MLNQQNRFREEAVSCKKGHEDWPEVRWNPFL